MSRLSVFFHNASVKRKLNCIVMLASSIVLVVTSLIVTTLDQLDHREEMATKLTILADIVGDNSKAALAFNDDVDAKGTLSSLGIEQNIMIAALYRTDGTVMATYRRDSRAELPPHHEVQHGDYRFEHGRLTLCRNIMLDGATIGRLHIEYDTVELENNLLRNLGILFLIMILCSILAYLVTSKLQRILIRPISELTTVSKEVARKDDYSIRAVRSTNDEIGYLTDQFNEMLTEIQKRDRSLQDARIQIENKAAELLRELQERRRAEAELNAKTEELVRINRELEQSDHQTKLLLNTIDAGILLVDCKTHEIVFANAVAIDIIGVPCEQIIGSICHQFICPAEKGRCPVSDLSQKVDRSERVLINGRGGRVPILKTVKTIHIGGRECLAESFMDISARKQMEDALKSSAEELARSNRELEQFAYVASHDLQEPLRMITSYVQLLAKRYKGRLDADADDFIHYAVDGAKRMQSLINDLLMYSRVGTRGKPFASTDCGEVLRDSLSNLNIVIEESGAAVTADPLPTLTADRGQLTQLFQNLIGNAVKFRNEQASRVHVSSCRENGCWHFSVRDNGIGIPQEQQEKIFAIFNRLHDRSKYPGSGIGLAVCKKIVERHGGRIWVESVPDLGSTFHFTVAFKGEPS